MSALGGSLHNLTLSVYLACSLHSCRWPGRCCLNTVVVMADEPKDKEKVSNQVWVLGCFWFVFCVKETTTTTRPKQKQIRNVFHVGVWSLLVRRNGRTKEQGKVPIADLRIVPFLSICRRTTTTTTTTTTNRPTTRPTTWPTTS